MNIDTKILIDEFLKWYKTNEHSKNEDYYNETLTFENLSQMNDNDLISFFEQFAKDGGKIQSGGQRTASKFIENIKSDIKEFKNRILEPFISDFNIENWLNWADNFQYFGQGLATIYLNRVNKQKYAVINNKSLDAYKQLGYNIKTSSLNKKYFSLLDAQKDLIDKFPEIENFYKADAFSHFLIGTDEGKELISRFVSDKTSFLDNIITEIKNKFVEEKHPLANHEWKNNNSENYRQISVVPSTILKGFALHYELMIYSKGICFEIHQEGKKKKQRKKKSITTFQKIS